MPEGRLQLTPHRARNPFHKARAYLSTCSAVVFPLGDGEEAEAVITVRDFLTRNPTQDNQQETCLALSKLLLSRPAGNSASTQLSEA